NTGNAVTPAISPDGAFVVYARAETLGWPSSLWVRQVSTGSSTQIVAPEPDVLVAAPTVTPDGRFVDFIRLRMTDEPLTPRLWRVPFLGGVPQRIADGVWSPVGWSPDGSRMAFTRLDSSTSTTALVLADAEGGAEQVVATRTLPRIFLNLGVVGRPPVRPAWSPDGGTVALLEVGTGSGFELRVVFVDAATGTTTALDAQGAWSAQSLAWLGPRSLV